MNYRNIMTLISCFCFTVSFSQNNADIDLDFNIIDGFGHNGGYPGLVNSIDLQQDGKVVAGGNFIFYNGATSKNLARLNSDGSFDDSFDVGESFDSSVSHLKVMPDGKIMVSGGFTSYNGHTAGGIIRLNSDGSIDTTFDTGTGFFNNYGALGVFSFDLQSDGKIVAGGNIDMFNDHIVNQLARINPDGSFDETFSETSGFSAHPISSIKVLQDDKILVGGRFNYSYDVDGEMGNTNGIVRLNPDGTYDSAFQTGIGFTSATSSTSINAIIELTDGRLLLGGSFTAYDGIPVYALIRLYPDGSRDETFHVVPNANLITITDLAVQNDGKILVGGLFETYDGVTSKNIVRLHENGEVDTSFDVGTGFDQGVKGIRIQEDGKIVVSGSFSYYNGNNYKGIIRLMGTPTLSVAQINNESLKIYPNPTSDVLYFSFPLSKIDLFGREGKKIFESDIKTDSLNIKQLPQGTYFIRAKTENGEIYKAKFIKKN
ncbi:MAG: T9SS type A sorting domain-containing protein [Weeksellaceae bacterium]|jgi:uncharacterized delta-60 repeat protein|nr:T9SS type A sorting domain-containing protein [Weeksellaceae bacterium]MDX9704376.1 T9SS type A sorting domain-containing protein [Weeksellaceae bacterium]